MINLALLGAGRIGAVHAANIAAYDSTNLKWVVDVFEASAKKLAEPSGAKMSTDPGDALSDPDVISDWQRIGDLYVLETSEIPPQTND